MLPHQVAKKFSSTLQQSKRLSAIYFSAILEKPKEPSMESCCGDGCIHCVWVDYIEKENAYQDTVKFLQKKISASLISRTNFEGIYYSSDPEVITKVQEPRTGDIEMLTPVKRTPHFFIP